MATTEPAPLSVAPVPAIHESRWPPTMTIWSLRLGSVPGISATVSKPCSMVAGEFGFDVHLHRDGHVRFEQAIDAAVVLDGGDDDGDLDGFVRACTVCMPSAAPLSSKNVPPEPPPFLPSRLGRTTPATFSSARKAAILSRSAARLRYASMRRCEVGDWRRVRTARVLRGPCRCSARRAACRPAGRRAFRRAGRSCRRACPCICRSLFRRR